jgi:hypothetical protein
MVLQILNSGYLCEGGGYGSAEHKAALDAVKKRLVVVEAKIAEQELEEKEWPEKVKAWTEECFQLLRQAEPGPLTPEQERKFREQAETIANCDCNYIFEGCTPSEALSEEMSRGL